MSITGFANVPVKFAREQGYYCNNICFDVFVKCFLLVVLVEIKPSRMELKMVLRATIANLVDTKGVQIGAKFIQEHTEPRDCCC